MRVHLWSLWRLSPVVLALAAVTAASCENKNETAPTPTPTLAGTWHATTAEFVNLANSSQRVEAVSKGSTLVLVLDAAGTFTFTTTDPGQPPDIFLGTWGASSDVITLTLTNRQGTIQFDFTLSGNTLHLEGGHVPYDVNGDDIDEESILTMSMARQ